jgi:hypothetical protein
MRYHNMFLKLSLENHKNPTFLGDPGIIGTTKEVRIGVNTNLIDNKVKIPCFMPERMQHPDTMKEETIMDTTIHSQKMTIQSLSRY